jgi:hypothetical protein
MVTPPTAASTRTTSSTSTSSPSNTSLPSDPPSCVGSFRCTHRTSNLLTPITFSSPPHLIPSPSLNLFNLLLPPLASSPDPTTVGAFTRMPTRSHTSSRHSRVLLRAASRSSPAPTWRLSRTSLHVGWCMCRTPSWPRTLPTVTLGMPCRCSMKCCVGLLCRGTPCNRLCGQRLP